MKNDDLYNYMELPTIMIHQSFRYVLGRRTYAVGVWVDWAVENWKSIPEKEKITIREELKKAFELDCRDKDKEFKHLGDDCDKAYWIKLNRVIDLERLDKLSTEERSAGCDEIYY